MIRRPPRSTQRRRITGSGSEQIGESSFRHLFEIEDDKQSAREQEELILHRIYTLPVGQYAYTKRYGNLQR